VLLGLERVHPSGCLTSTALSAQTQQCGAGSHRRYDDGYRGSARSKRTKLHDLRGDDAPAPQECRRATQGNRAGRAARASNLVTLIGQGEGNLVDAIHGLSGLLVEDGRQAFAGRLALSKNRPILGELDDWRRVGIQAHGHQEALLSRFSANRAKAGS
jgi:hypothetical protein